MCMGKRKWVGGCRSDRGHMLSPTGGGSWGRLAEIESIRLFLSNGGWYPLRCNDIRTIPPAIGSYNSRESGAIPRFEGLLTLAPPLSILSLYSPFLPSFLPTSLVPSYRLKISPCLITCQLWHLERILGAGLYPESFCPACVRSRHKKGPDPIKDRGLPGLCYGLGFARGSVSRARH